MYSSRFLLFICIGIVAFTSCEPYYPKVSEVLLYTNKTDSTVYIYYGFLHKTESVFADNGSVQYYYGSNSFVFDNSLVTNLWMSEQDFNKYVSQIKMYRVTLGDTTYVNPLFYANKSLWKHTYHSEYNVGMRESTNELTITPEMFIHK